MMLEPWSKVRSTRDAVIRKRTQRKLVTWLAFVALGLILFAPSISRSLQIWASDHDRVALTSDCPEHAAHPHHSGMPEHPSVPEKDSTCGYCTLMYHSPALTLGVAFIVPPLTPVPFLAIFHDARAPAPAQLNQRSRGPPVV